MRNPAWHGHSTISPSHPWIPIEVWLWWQSHVDTRSWTTTVCDQPTTIPYGLRPYATIIFHEGVRSRKAASSRARLGLASFKHHSICVANPTIPLARGISKLFKSLSRIQGIQTLPPLCCTWILVATRTVDGVLLNLSEWLILHGSNGQKSTSNSSLMWRFNYIFT